MKHTVVFLLIICLLLGSCAEQNPEPEMTTVPSTAATLPPTEAGATSNMIFRNSDRAAFISSPTKKQTLQLGIALAATAALVKMPVASILAAVPEVPSFASITAAMDKSYFAEHTLLLVYLSAGSCSFRYDVSHVDMENNTIRVYLMKGLGSHEN